MFSFSPVAANASAPGLRERKKARTRRAIVEAAERLMKTRGYDETTMEQVAHEAEVSVGTLYNYFPTKQGLLLGVVAHAGADLLRVGQSVVEAPSADPKRAIGRLLDAYMQVLGELDKDLLRKSFGFAFTEPPEMSEGLVRLDFTMIDQLAGMVRSFQKSGLLSRDVGAEEAAVAVYSAFCVSVLFWLGLPDADWSSATGILEQQLSVVFRGLEPRESPKEA